MTHADILASGLDRRAPGDGRVAVPRDLAARWSELADIDPETGQLLGNSPQVDAHVGLINAAMTIGICSMHAMAGCAHGRETPCRTLPARSRLTFTVQRGTPC